MQSQTYNENQIQNVGAKNIVHTNNVEQFLINGRKYRKVGEDANMMYFVDVENGEKMSMKKS